MSATSQKGPSLSKLNDTETSTFVVEQASNGSALYGAVFLALSTSHPNDEAKLKKNDSDNTFTLIMNCYKTSRP